MKTIVTVWAIGSLVSLAALVGTLYVVIHFIQKFW